MAIAEIESGSTDQSAHAGERRFSAVREGFDPQEVRAYERATAEELAQVRGALEWERARREALERRIRAAEETAYARISRDFGEMLRGADAEVARVRSLSGEQAHALVSAAQAEAGPHDRRRPGGRRAGAGGGPGAGHPHDGGVEGARRRRACRGRVHQARRREDVRRTPRRSGRTRRPVGPRPRRCGPTRWWSRPRPTR